MILHCQKEEGETPLELIDRLREGGPISKNEKATYAGRLDPLASGEMIILTSEDVHRKEEFMGQDKEYEVEVLFGFATDSFDILGKITEASDTKKPLDNIFLILQSFVGKFVQEYPRYSSRVIAMNEVPDELPTNEVEIYSVNYLGMHEKQSLELLADIQMRIAKVNGDFRQQEILDLWAEQLLNNRGSFSILKIEVRCSSGTYMRALAHMLGKKLATPALAYTIKRKKVIIQ